MAHHPYAQRLFWFAQLLRLPSILIFARMAGALSGMFVTLLLSQHFGAARFGQIAQTLSLVMVLSLFCTVTIEAGSPKFMITTIRKHNFDAAHNFARFSICVWILMSLAVVFVTGIWAASEQLSSLYWMAIISAPIVGLTRILAGLSMGFSKVFHAIIPRSFLRQFLFLIGVSCIIFLHPTAMAHWVIILFAIANIGVVIVQYKLLSPQISFLKKNIEPKQSSFADWARWLRLGIVAGSGVLFIEFNQHFAVLIASISLPHAELALLDISLKIIGFVCFGVTAVNQSYLPKIAQAYAVDDRSKMNVVFKQSSLLRLCLSVVITALIYLCSTDILALFGPEIIAGNVILIALLWVPLLMAFFGPAQQVLSLMENTKSLMILVGISLCALFIGVAIGGAQWGGVGAACGIVFAWIVWTVMGAYLVFRKTGIHTSALVFFQQVDVGER